MSLTETAILLLFCFLLLTAGKWWECFREVKALRIKVASQETELRARKRASLKDLTGVETRDFLDLIHYHLQGDDDDFSATWKESNEKSQQAFEEWKERDKHIASTPFF